MSAAVPLSGLPAVLARQADPVLTDRALTGVDWLWAGGIVLGSITVAIAMNRITRAALGRALGTGMAAIVTARLIGYLLVLIGLVYALSHLGVRVGPLLGALGLGGLVIALALQKVVENFVGALILQARRPFTVGDIVTLNDQTGFVVDIDSRTTVLRGLDGTTIRIPNGEVLSATIINLTRERVRRSELDVGVAYDTDLERATETLRAAVTRVPRVLAQPAPAVLLRRFGASSIDFTIFYWHASDVAGELETTHDLILAVHHGFADAGITIAFPQLVVWSGTSGDPNPYRRAPGEVFTTSSRPPADDPRSDDTRRWRIRRRG